MTPTTNSRTDVPPFRVVLLGTLAGLPIPL
jgi:hypothetical protein